MKLTTYFRSTAAYRVRIALNLKGVKHQLVPLNLFTGEQNSDDFLNTNPDGLIPVLDTGIDILTQSMAILEYLEEIRGEVKLLPDHPADRAFVRALAQTIISDIHPLNNLRVQQYLVTEMGVSEEKKRQWYRAAALYGICFTVLVFVAACYDIGTIKYVPEGNETFWCDVVG